MVKYDGHKYNVCMESPKTLYLAVVAYITIYKKDQTDYFKKATSYFYANNTETFSFSNNFDDLIKPFVPPATLQTIYKKLMQPYFDYSSPYGIIVVKYSKFRRKNSKTVGQGLLLSAGLLGSDIKIHVACPCTHFVSL